MARAQTSLPPGFRFHPTDVELVSYYLKRKIMQKRLLVEAITEIELYKYAPWDLPDKSCIRSKDLEWYFFSPRDKKYLNGSRTNRATPNGYWKTTGKDRTIVLNSRTVGMKKTLIFHEGKAPKGGRTDWVMYEYRMEDNDLVVAGFSKDAYVLCKIFQKSGIGPRIGEQYGAPFDEEEWENVDTETAVLPLMSCPSSGLVNAVEQPPIHHTVAANAVEEQPALHPAVASAIEELPFEHTVAAGADEEPSSQDTLKSSGYKVVSANHTSAVNVYDPPEFDGIFLEELASLLNDSPYRDSASAELAVLPAIPEAEAQALQMNSDDIYNELAELVDSGHVPAANDPCPNYTYA